MPSLPILESPTSVEVGELVYPPGAGKVSDSPEPRRRSGPSSSPYDAADDFAIRAERGSTYPGWAESCPTPLVYPGANAET